MDAGAGGDAKEKTILDKLRHEKHNVVLPINNVERALSDYCLLHSHPLPSMNIIQDTGFAETREIMAFCSLYTIERYGVSKSESEARERAAYAVFKELIYSYDEQIQSYVRSKESEKSSTDDNVPETSQRIRRYVNFCKYFTSAIRAEAWRVINDPTMSPIKARAFNVMSALRLKPMTSYTTSLDVTDPILLMEFDSEYELVFHGEEPLIYHKIIDHFHNLLN